jgi:hypothetical protein
MSVGKNLVILLISIACLMAGNTASADDCNEARQWYNEGLALSDSSEREARYYQRAIKLCPDYFEAHNKLGEVYKSWGKYESAIKEFEQAIRGPLFAEPHNSLGEIYRMQGRYDLAAEEFIKAIRIRPGFREAQINLKYVYKRLGKYDFVIEKPPEPIPISIFTRIPGMALPKGSFLVDFQYKFWTQEAGLTEDMFVGDVPPLLSPPANREVNVDLWIWGIRYGLTNNLTIGLIPKLFSRKAKVPIRFVGIEAQPGITGLGDTVLLTKYRFWGRRRTNISAFHLLSIPTGDEDAVAEDQEVRRRIPLGSGSFDFTPGIAFTTVREPLTIHSNIWYVITSRRQSGDEFHWDFALALSGFRNMIGIMELNYRWVGTAIRQQFFQTAFFFRPQVPVGLQRRFAPPGGPPATTGPITQESTIREKSGHTLFLSPGVQIFLTRELKAEWGVQLPVINPKDAWAEEIILHFGLMRYFF